MKRMLLASLFSICIALLITTAFLLINPFPVFAATGTAKCGPYTNVSCPGNGTAATCSCTDYSGCTATFADGSTRTTNCSDFDGPKMEEGGV